MSENEHTCTLGTRGFFSLTSGEIGRRPSRVARRPTQRAAYRAGHNREHKLQPETAQEKPLAPRVAHLQRFFKPYKMSVDFTTFCAFCESLCFPCKLCPKFTEIL